jgi:hypothetical protein
MERMLMRFVMRCFLISLMLSGASISASSQMLTAGVPDFTLTLAEPTGPFRLGAPIHLMLSVTNTTDHVVSIPIPPGATWGDEIVAVDLVDSEGVPVPRWRDLAVPVSKWRDMKKEAEGGVRPISSDSISSDEIPPRRVDNRDVRVEKIFKITATGHYTVRVARWDPNSHTWVRSEAVGINIGPAS